MKISVNFGDYFRKIFKTCRLGCKFNAQLDVQFPNLIFEVHLKV